MKGSEYFLNALYLLPCVGPFRYWCPCTGQLGIKSSLSRETWKRFWEGFERHHPFLYGWLGLLSLQGPSGSVPPWCSRWPSAGTSPRSWVRCSRRTTTTVPSSTGVRDACIRPLGGRNNGRQTQIALLLSSIWTSVLFICSRTQYIGQSQSNFKIQYLTK